MNILLVFLGLAVHCKCQPSLFENASFPLLLALVDALAVEESSSLTTSLIKLLSFNKSLSLFLSFGLACLSLDGSWDSIKAFHLGLPLGIHSRF
jgi:hypothetical protein